MSYFYYIIWNSRVIHGGKFYEAVGSL